MHVSVVLSVVMSAAVSDSVFENSAAWSPVETDGALVLEQRAIEGSAYTEFRVTTFTDVAPDVLCATIFEWTTVGKDRPSIKSSKLLQDGPMVRVTYNQLGQALTSDRDYTATTTRQAIPGGCRIRTKVTNEVGPKPAPDVVRIENLWNGWTVEPVDGKTKLTHVLFADPAGSFPLFMVAAAEKRSAKTRVMTVIEKARAAKR